MNRRSPELVAFLNALRSVGSIVEGGPNRWTAQCPSHDDRKPSLSIAVGHKHPVIFHCHARCDPEAILDELGLDWQEMGNGDSRVIDEYDYHDSKGELLYWIERTSSKGFRVQRREDTEVKAGLGPHPKVLYRLPRVVRAVESGKRIYVVEGEKDVDTIERHGAVATTNPFGAGSWEDEYAQVLRGADVIVVADRDEPGREHAREVRDSLKRVGCRVEVVQAAEGNDATDHLDAGFSLGDLVPVEPGDLISEAFDRATPEYYRTRIESLADLLAKPPPEEHVAGLLIQGSLSVLYGRWGIGKSFVAIDLALAVATGRTWFGRPVKQANVLYVSAEGEAETSRRMRAWMLRHEVATAPVSSLPEPLPLVDSNITALGEVLREKDVGFVVIDTLNRCMPGADENSAKDMSSAVEALDSLRRASGATILLVHHATKAGNDMRGSSALHGAVDSILVVKRDAEILEIESEKQRSLPPDTPIYMRLVEHAGSAVLEDSFGPSTKRGGHTDTQLQFLRLIRKEFGFEPAPKADVVKALQASDLKGTSSTNVYKVLGELESEGSLLQEGTATRSYLVLANDPDEPEY